MSLLSIRRGQVNTINGKKHLTITKMLAGYFLLIFISHTPANVEGIEILEQLLSPIISFKESLINGIIGKGGKCGCPCRTYWVPKCEIAYVQQCHYDHYEQQVCNTVPVPELRQAKETECQRCRKYTVPVQKTKWAVECNPIYDEKCKTSYPQHCKVEQRCHALYQTVCENNSYGGYSQNCGSVPREHCYPETKCHRTPMTRCKPVQKEKCVKVPREVTVQKEEKQCLPFDINQAELDAQNNFDPCAQQGFVGLDGHAGGQHGIGAGYGGNVQHDSGAHHANLGHAHQPVNDVYSVGTQQQVAVGGYQVGNVANHHQAAGFGRDHAHVQQGSHNVPLNNLYTVDAYVPGGVIVNEQLPSNQYYGGRIGERRQVPQGVFPQVNNQQFQHQFPQSNNQQLQHQSQMYPNHINVAVVQDPILAQQHGGQIQYNRKRQLNPANKSKNPFLRKPKIKGGYKKQPRSFDGIELPPSTSSNPIRFEETNTIDDSIFQHKKRKETSKKELEIAMGRFTHESYAGWKPILYPVDGRRR